MSKPQPQSLESERALLGGLMVHEERVDEISGIVRPEDFYRPEHAALYELLLAMRDEGTPIDLVSVPERVVRSEDEGTYGGLAYVLQLPEHLPSAANLSYYAELVRQKALMRKLARIGTRLHDKATAEADDPPALMTEVAALLDDLGRDDAERDWTPVSEAVDEYIRQLEDLSVRQGAVTGLSTGYTELDKLLAGFHPSTLVVLAARPAMGKTALALNFARHALEAGAAAAFFSLEMGRTELVSRMLGAIGSIEGDALRRGQLDQEGWDRLMSASRRLREMPLYIDDTPGVTIADLRARARRLQAMDPRLGMVLIDYLQLMQGEDARASRQQQIAEISRGLKILSKDLKVPVIALSQLNRSVEQRENKRPRVSDIRESGAIEQDADVILFIYRDEVYDPESEDRGTAEVIIAKHRAGSTGMVRLAFQGVYARFDNAASESRLSGLGAGEGG